MTDIGHIEEQDKKKRGLWKKKNTKRGKPREKEKMSDKKQKDK